MMLLNILDDAEKQIMDVSSDTNSAGFRNIKEVVQKALDEINAAKQLIQM